MKVKEKKIHPIFYELNFFFLKLFVIQQRDSIEPFFKNYLIEDKGFTGGASYVDFLYHLHREIRNILQ